MDTYFMDKEHRNRFTCLMSLDHTVISDTERISLFYIISGSEELYSKRSHIYNFKSHGIKRCMKSKEVDFSSGMSALLRLGFNLFNGYKDNGMTPLDVFWNLDSDKRLLAYNAIRLRFNDRIV